MHRIFSAIAALVMTAGTVAFGAPAHAAQPAACETVTLHAS
ncbi:MAG TPA: hypothetical protein VGB04_06465 [Allosphingosinicella sp.]|jgi:ABC-type proline/glycine betaine transport system substrate-binding protein